MPDVHRYVEHWLADAGLSKHVSELVGPFIVLAAAILLAVVANWAAKRVILRIVKRVISKTEVKWDDVIMENHVFDRLSHLAPALILYMASFVTFPGFDDVQSGMRQACLAYMIVVVAVVFDGLLNAGVQIYATFPVARTRPIRSYVQVIKVIAYIVTAILVISMITNRSPWGFLSGVAGLTAVIMLVFKDSILGLVASIQLTANNMVHVGDWIEMPEYGADGDVLDISLNTVKVQNWDKTISTIPTYALISQSFRNWRGMQESGGRRIKRAVYLDMNSVHFLADDEIERLSKVQLLHEYLAQKRSEIDSDNKNRNADLSQPANGRRLTNLGTFRAYVQQYLRAHPKIHQDMTFLVRQLAPGPQGVGIEVYVFSNDQVWANYEALQADIFDHLLAVVPQFGLRVFQELGGADLRDAAQSLPRAG